MEVGLSFKWLMHDVDDWFAASYAGLLVDSSKKERADLIHRRIGENEGLYRSRP